MITLIVLLVLSVPAAGAGYFCYLCSQADLIVITSGRGRDLTIDCSRWFKRGSHTVAPVKKPGT